jgi:hypothetical protein
VPLSNDVATFAESRSRVEVGSHAYVAAGSELLVLEAGLPQGNSTLIVAARLDLTAYPLFQPSNRSSPVLELAAFEGRAKAISLLYGLASTFRIQQLLVPANNRQRLLLLGSAIDAVPGPSPLLSVGSTVMGQAVAGVTSGTTYHNTDLRLFHSTVSVVVDIANPLKPVPVSVTEHEGRFVTARAQAGTAWIFVENSAHVGASVNEDESATRDIMPVYRVLNVTDSSPTPWQPMCDCTSVRKLEVGAPPTAGRKMITSISVPLRSLESLEAGSLDDIEHNPFVLAWTDTVRPLFDGQDSRELLMH